MRHFGVTARGVRMPVIKQGDDLATLIPQHLFQAIDEEKISVHDHDVIGITESIVARAQGNYASIDDIAHDVRAKLGEGTVGLVFPILSRNRFLALLQGIAKGVDHLVIQLSYPSDEVGNGLVDVDRLDAANVDPYKDVFTEKEFRALLGPELLHPFTQCDYPKLYREVSANIEIIFANDPREILKYTRKVIAGDIHTRARTKRLLKQKGATVIGLDEILNHSINGSGFNPSYGILGSNFAAPGKIKLFPRDSQALVDGIQKAFFDKYHKTVEVLVYGDGAFKDPVGKIWELADPVVAPFYTSGLKGTPHELKFKLLADTTFAALKGEQAQAEMKKAITKNKEKDHQESALGTTPRNLTDLIGSLCDLTSGSGDKGTPVIYLQGYFDTYSEE
mgnify:FL=1